MRLFHRHPEWATAEVPDSLQIVLSDAAANIALSDAAATSKSWMIESVSSHFAYTDATMWLKCVCTVP